MITKFDWWDDYLINGYSDKQKLKIFIKSLSRIYKSNPMKIIH